MSQDSQTVLHPLKATIVSSPANQARPVHNALLASLPQIDAHAILARACVVELSAGELLHHASVPLDGMYFPTTTLVSLRYDLAEGVGGELALVGDEGFIGGAMFIASPWSPNRAVVHSSGWAYAVSGDAIAAQLGVGTSVPARVNTYAQVLLAKMAATALCNVDHSAKQRLSRWLLLQFDRVGSVEFCVSLPAMAAAVGLHVANVAFSLSRLRSAGIVQFSRDHISLRDRQGLHEQSCACYRAIKALSDVAI